jgi:cytochrome c-type biogenesis protein CcmH/NrfG
MGLAFGLYANTIGHGYVLDDGLVTEGNRLVKEGQIEKIGEIFRHGYVYGFYGYEGSSYRPLTLASLLLERSIFGSSPTVHHLFNVLYYALLCGVALLLLRLLLGTERRGLALVVALLFCAHPIHTEVVANIKSRDEILALFWSISALALVLLALRRQQARYHWLAGLALLLGLLSKESAAPTLALVPLALFFASPSARPVTILRQSLPCLLAVLVYFALRASVLGGSTAGTSGGSLGVINNGLLAAATSTERWATAIAILGKYLRLLFLPHPLIYDYSYRQIPIVGPGDLAFVAALVAHLGLAAYAVYRLKRRDPIAFGIIYYAATLGLVSNLFFLVGATAAERFLFAPSLGFCLALVFALSRLLQRAAARAALRPVGIAAVVLVLVVLGGLTVRRNQDWRDEATLFAADVVKAPHSARALHYHGRQLALRARSMQHPTSLVEEAEALFKRSVGIVPEYYDAWHSLGMLYARQRRFDRAIAAYRRGLDRAPEKHVIHLNLALAHYLKGDYAAARPLFERVLARDPGNANAMGYLGEIAHRQQRYQEALRYYEAAKPQNIARLTNIVRIAQHLGQRQKARHYQELLDAARAGARPK